MLNVPYLILPPCHIHYVFSCTLILQPLTWKCAQCAETAQEIDIWGPRGFACGDCFYSGMDGAPAEHASRGEQMFSNKSASWVWFVSQCRKSSSDFVRSPQRSFLIYFACRTISAFFLVLLLAAGPGGGEGPWTDFRGWQRALNWISWCQKGSCVYQRAPAVPSCWVNNPLHAYWSHLAYLSASDKRIS